MKKPILIFFLLFILLLVPTVISVKIESNVFSEIGIQIKYPIIENINIGEDLTLHFHLFNISDGRYITENVNCTFHLYAPTGGHILIKDISTFEDIYDIEVKINAGNFTEKKLYSYIIQCQTNTGTTIGGFDSVGIMVGGSDEETKDKAWLPIIICLIAMAFLFIYSSTLITKKEFMPIKGLLFLLGTLHALIIGTIPFLISLNPLDSSTFYPVAMGYFSVNVLTIMLFFYLRGFGLIRRFLSFKDPEKGD